MKKLLLISVLLGSIIVAGCGKQQGLSQEELFEKKQECLKYRNILEKELSGDFGSRIEEIFYSEKNITCYGSISSLTLEINMKTYWIIDLLSNKYIESIEGNGRIMLNENTYKQKIKELKGE